MTIKAPSTAPNLQFLQQTLQKYWDGEIAYVEFISTVNDLEMVRLSQRSGDTSGVSETAGTRSGRHTG